MAATQLFFIFTPKIGEDLEFDIYLSDGLKAPTRIHLVAGEKKAILALPQCLNMFSERQEVEKERIVG